MHIKGFFALADSYPQREVLIDASGQGVTAGALLAGMNRVARGIRRLGLSPGDTLAVVLSNRREFLECYGAAIQSGLYFVAINWHLGPAEISYILDDANAGMVVTEPRFSDVVAATEDATIERAMVFALDGGSALRPFGEVTEGESAAAPPDRTAGQIMFYTSGTTGRPKGVRKSFRGQSAGELTLTSGIGPIRRAWQPNDASSEPTISDAVYLASGPFYHALPIAGVVNALDTGGVVVVIDTWSPEAFLALVERHGVTHATVVPTMFHRLLALPEDVRARADVSSLRAVNHAGAPCPVDVKRRMIDWWGPIITESYSSTEGAGTTVSSEEWLRKPGTVGRPSPGVEIKILGDDGAECPPGEQGLVYMTPSLWDFEYHHDQAKTRAARQDNMFTVGDIGYLDEDGYLFLCDRQADTIIAGGVNIYPAEVEATLLEHPGVRDAAVIGVPNAEWGEEVRAVVELQEPAQASPDLGNELIHFCQSRIARFKCPRAVDFVATLHRDPNGKLRKGALRARYWPQEGRRI